MPKPRMKNYDLSNVGGRIRKARREEKKIHPTKY